MSESTIDQVERLAEQLSPSDQARLLSTLAHRMAQLMTSPSAVSALPPAAADGWEEFFRLGDSLTASDTQEEQTLTAVVLSMRR